MPIYNKLVRDNIPDIIEATGNTPVFRILDETEYKKSLLAKLIEEVQELTEAHDEKEKKDVIEEIADVQEVLTAFMKSSNINITQVQRAMVDKACKNGKFNEQIFLESVKNGND